MPASKPPLAGFGVPTDPYLPAERKCLFGSALDLSNRGGRHRRERRFLLTSESELRTQRRQPIPAPGLPPRSQVGKAGPTPTC